MFKQSLVAFAAVLSLASGLARADATTFQYSGTVTYGGYMALPGAQITGTFSYDPGSPGDVFNGYAIYEFNAPSVMTAKVGGHTVTSERMLVSIWDNYGGNVEDMVNLAGYSIVVDGTTFSSGNLVLVLGSGPGKTEVLKSTALPQSYSVNRFLAGGHGTNYGTIQTDGGQLGTLLQFSIDSIKVVQKP